MGIEAGNPGNNPGTRLSKSSFYVLKTLFIYNFNEIESSFRFSAQTFRGDGNS